MVGHSHTATFWVLQQCSRPTFPKRLRFTPQYSGRLVGDCNLDDEERDGGNEGFIDRWIGTRKEGRKRGGEFLAQRVLSPRLASLGNQTVVRYVR